MSLRNRWAFVLLLAFLFPCAGAKAELPPPVATNIQYDALRRVIAADGKQLVDCPRQDDRTAVLLIIGQSNAANFATQAYQSRHGASVLNLFAGRCYLASSPLLGADGPWGEYWTELGNRLVESGRYDKVILVSSAIGGSSITQWRMDKPGSGNGRLGAMLMDVVRDTRQRYAITHVLWHQGEADTDMPVEDYRQGFLSLASRLRDLGVTAPVHVSVTSASGGSGEGDSPVVRALKSLPGSAPGLIAGVNTDELVRPEERNSTGHFGPRAQEKVIAAWLGILAPQVR